MIKLRATEHTRKMVSLFFGRLIRGRNLSLADSDPLSIKRCTRFQTEMWCIFQSVVAPENDDVVNNFAVMPTSSMAPLSSLRLRQLRVAGKNSQARLNLDLKAHGWLILAFWMRKKIALQVTRVLIAPLYRQVVVLACNLKHEQHMVMGEQWSTWNSIMHGIIGGHAGVSPGVSSPQLTPASCSPGV